jgi:hypothetical protein
MMSLFATAAWVGLVFISPYSARARTVGAEVGIVADYRPVTGRFFFRRAGGRDSVPVWIGAVVQAGDQIALPSGASVTIQLAEGRTIVFPSGTSVVPEAPSLPKRVAAIYHSLSAVFDTDFPQSRTAASRGSTSCVPGEPPAPIEVPVVVSGAKVAAGMRDLPVVWDGGCAPFIVALMKGSDTVAVQRAIDARQTRMNQVHLVAGRYMLRVSDGTGHRFEGILECVSGKPAAPEEILHDTTPLGVIAQAVWLAKIDGGRWRFDSFEMLRPLVRQRNPLAGAIADWILWGRD